MRGNVTELRHEMAGLRKRLDEAPTSGMSQETLPAAHPLATLEHPDTAMRTAIPTINTPISTVETPTSSPITSFVDADAEEINEVESLNLNDLGRQLVEKALEKNHGNRKKAAMELGISDRTLYRRIKQYGLESNK